MVDLVKTVLDYHKDYTDRQEQWTKRHRRMGIHFNITYACTGIYVGSILERILTGSLLSTNYVGGCAVIVSLINLWIMHRYLRKWQ